MSTRRLSDTFHSLTPDGSGLRGGIAAGRAVVERIDWRLRTDPGLLPPRRGARGGSQLAGGGVSVGEEGWEGCQACTRPSVAHTCSVHAWVHADQPIRNSSNPAATFWSGVSGSANHEPHCPPILRTCPSSGVAAPSSYLGSAGAPSNAGRIGSLGYFLLSWGEVGTGSPDRIVLMTQRPSSPPAGSCCSARTRP